MPQPHGQHARPQKSTYDVVIIGGAMMGSSVAWFLMQDPSFDGSVLVIEKDPSYANSSTAHSNSCIRQQFSTPLNIRISQFGVEFIKNFRRYQSNDPRVPDVEFNQFGYLYLAARPEAAAALRDNQEIQVSHGANTRILTPKAIAESWPFFNLDDIRLGTHGPVNEGYWDSGTVFEWLRRSARESGVEYITDEVVGLVAEYGQVQSVHLASGIQISCGHVVNAAGPRAAAVAQMADLDIPVEPRKRHTWVFEAETPLNQTLPLTVDPSGVHIRQDGPRTYMAGGHSPNEDPAVDLGDFHIDQNLWLDHAWPAIAHRIPQFEAIRVITEWAGHYAFNVFDQNAIVGPHPEIGNFLFINGFSGHGLQQAPAMGRGIAEWLIHGSYQKLDLSQFHYDRIIENRPVQEIAII